MQSLPTFSVSIVVFGWQIGFRIPFSRASGLGSSTSISLGGEGGLAPVVVKGLVESVGQSEAEVPWLIAPEAVPDGRGDGDDDG